jgi:hypothetical protein
VSRRPPPRPTGFGQRQPVSFKGNGGVAAGRAEHRKDAWIGENENLIARAQEDVLTGFLDDPGKASPLPSCRRG